MGKQTGKIDPSQVIKEIINVLVNYSEKFNEIDFDILADHLNVDKKILRNIIIDHQA